VSRAACGGGGCCPVPRPPVGDVPSRSAAALAPCVSSGNAQPPDDLSPWIPRGGDGFDIIVVRSDAAAVALSLSLPLPRLPCPALPLSTHMRQ
jgi:hypothetical protein